MERERETERERHREKDTERDRELERQADVQPCFKAPPQLFKSIMQSQSWEKPENKVNHADSHHVLHCAY